MAIANLNRLMVFHAVAETGSFTGAARQLFLTQSGVSKHVRLLEEEVRTKLFDRLGRRIVLTAPGRTLLRATREMVRLIQDAEAELTEAGGPAGTLVLAASVTAGTYILPAVLAEYRRQHERVDVRVDVQLGDEVVRAVLESAADVGIVGQPIDDPRLLVEPFLPDELVAIVPSGHPWAHRRSVELATLAQEVLLLSRPGSGTRRAVDGELARQRVQPRRVMEYGNTEAVMKAVSAGLGVALVSARAAGREAAAGAVSVLRMRGSPRVHRHFAAIRRRGRYLTGAARAFLELLARRERRAPGGATDLRERRDRPRARARGGVHGEASWPPRRRGARAEPRAAPGGRDRRRRGAGGVSAAMSRSSVAAYRWSNDARASAGGALRRSGPSIQSVAAPCPMVQQVNATASAGGRRSGGQRARTVSRAATTTA